MHVIDNNMSNNIEPIESVVFNCTDCVSELEPSENVVMLNKF